MSTSHTGCAQWERLVALGLDPLRLDDEIDIDDWSSACRVAAGAPQLRTAAAVRRIGERLGADV
jgi:hypothetical protein